MKIVAKIQAKKLDEEVPQTSLMFKKQTKQHFFKSILIYLSHTDKIIGKIPENLKKMEIRLLFTRV